jgi:hypothetical protein
MTHRSLSRNASSSRAIPPEEALKAIEADMAFPFHWGLNERGMQAHSYLVDPGEIRAARAIWKEAGRRAIRSARELFELFKLHKQVINRLTEPWSHIDVVATATDWENFFALRCHPDAEPGIRLLAWRMADVFYAKGHQPTVLLPGQWHLPFVTPEEVQTLDLETAKRCSVARCARASYRLHDGSATSVPKDLALCDRLLAGLQTGNGEPGHMSPFEHQATPLEDPMGRSGNFRGWLQFRKQIPGEAMTFDYQAAVARGWREIAYTVVPE